MIENLPERINKYGKADPLHNKIVDLLNMYVSEYQGSPCSKSLRRRYGIIDRALNLESDVAQQFNSKIVYPLVRIQRNLQRAVVKRATKHDPITTARAQPNTSIANARRMNILMEKNYHATEFRRKCLDPVITSCCDFGAAVTVTRYRDNYKPFTAQAINPLTGMSERILITDNRKAMVETGPLHICRYLQDPLEPEPTAAAFQGHVQRQRMSQLYSAIKKEMESPNSAYIKENLKYVLEELKKGDLANSFYFETMDDVDHQAGMAGNSCDRFFFHAELPIPGNEEDPTRYYVEVVNNCIIRIQSHLYDYNRTGYSIFKFEERPEFWWGNSKVESFMGIKDYYELLLNVTGDQALISIDELKFYPTGKVDLADIMNRKKHGGWIGYKPDEKFQIQNMIMKFDPADPNLASANFMASKMDMMAQQMSEKPGYEKRSAGQTGLANNTAFAAAELADLGDMLQEDYLRTFAYGLQNLGMETALQMMLFFPEETLIEYADGSEIVPKSDWIGEYDMIARDTLFTNREEKARDLNNKIAQVMQMSQHPQLANSMQIVPMVREWVKTWELENIDVDQVLPEQAPGMMPMQQAGMPPGMPQQMPPQMQGAA